MVFDDLFLEKQNACEKYIRGRQIHFVEFRFAESKLPWVRVRVRVSS